MTLRLAAALAAASLLAACGTRPADTPATIVLVTIDTLRADRVGAYGHAAAHTPVLDDLARRGVAFDRAYTPTPLTLPSHASMLTGLAPDAHGVRDDDRDRLDDTARLVSEVLADAGWHTAAFVGAGVLDASSGVLQGFAHRTTPSTSARGRVASVAERRADAVVDDAAAWLAELPRDEPAFLWVHLHDPHAPYAPPPEAAARTDDAYDGEVSFADEQLGRLLDAVARHRPVAEHAPWILVASDHGEALGDHGETGHGLLLYEPTVRVPLIVAGPHPALVPGTRSDALVALTDVAPTLLEAAGLPRAALPGVDAPSLPASLTSPDLGRRVALETLRPYHVHRWRGLRAVVEGRFKTIGPGDVEVFDVVTDPAERHDLSADPPSDAPELGERAAALDRSEQRDIADTARTRPRSPGGDPFDLDLPDPRERRADIARRDAAAELLSRGRRLLRLDPDPTGAVHVPGDSEARRRARGAAALDDAARVLAEMGGLESGDPWVVEHVGRMESSRGDPAAAASAFERHALLAPTDASTHRHLGECYRRLDHDAWAVDEVVKALHLAPDSALAYEWLLAWHDRRGDRGAVTYWMQRYAAAFDARDDLAERLARLRAAGAPAHPSTPAEVERVDRLRATDPDGWLVPERLRAEGP